MIWRLDHTMGETYMVASLCTRELHHWEHVSLCSLLASFNLWHGVLFFFSHDDKKVSYPPNFVRVPTFHLDTCLRTFSRTEARENKLSFIFVTSQKSNEWNSTYGYFMSINTRFGCMEGLRPHEIAMIFILVTPWKIGFFVCALIRV